jgi:hypothetical protein
MKNPRDHICHALDVSDAGDFAILLADVDAALSAREVALRLAAESLGADSQERVWLETLGRRSRSERRRPTVRGS